MPGESDRMFCVALVARATEEQRERALRKRDRERRERLERAPAGKIVGSPKLHTDPKSEGHHWTTCNHHRNLPKK